MKTEKCMSKEEEAVFILESFLKWNNDKQYTVVDHAIETLLEDYKKEKSKRIELQEKLNYLHSLRDCDEEFEL